VADGLGPLYNAQSCRACHQNPTSGGASQVSELRVGHLGPDGRFVNPDIPIARGTETIKGRTLVNDREIGTPRGFGFIEMSTADAARAMQGLDGKDYDGRPMKVNEAGGRGGNVHSLR